MKRVIFTALMAVLTIGFVSALGEAESAESTEAVELNFFQFKPYLDEAYGKLAAEFEALHPNVTVVIETKGGGTQWQTILRGQFAANEGPDIFPVEGPGQYETWKDFIADLSKEAWNKTALPFALEPLNIEGKQWGMPVNLEGYGYIYNKDIFAEAGVATPPRTLSELRTAAQKIKAAGYTPFATGYATWWVLSLHLLNVAFAHQDDPIAFIEDLNEGRTSLASNRLFQDLQDLIDLTIEFGEDTPLTTDHNRQVQLFSSGEVAMIQQGVWKEIPIFEANPDINIGLLPMPLNNSDQAGRVAVGVPFFFAVNSDSTPAEQRASREFLDFMVRTEVGQRYATEEFGFIPSYSGVSSQGLGGVGQDILAYASDDKTVPWMFGRFPDGFADDATRHLQAYVGGQTNWNETLKNLDESWTQRAR